MEKGSGKWGRRKWEAELVITTYNTLITAYDRL